MEQQFGARLRHHREQLGVTLAQICADTKIKPSLLESLESDDVSHWPKGLFGRAYLREYARAIGLNAEVVVSEFLALHPGFARGNPELDEREAVERSKAAQRPSGRLRRALDAFAPARTLRIPVRVESPDPVTEATAIVIEPSATAAIDLTAFADICTRLARAVDWTEVGSVLGGAAGLLDASGVIVWQWNEASCVLRPVLAHGYPADVLARIPAVNRDAGNAVAAAFRTGGQQLIEDADGGVEALVVPATGVSGCAGVLALELRATAPPRDCICPLATILAAQLAMLIAPAESA